MQSLTQAQVDEFWAVGAVTIPNAISPDELSKLQNQFSGWVEESRSHSEAYGKIMDGRPRFDVEPDHTAKYSLPVLTDLIENLIQKSQLFMC